MIIDFGGCLMNKFVEDSSLDSRKKEIESKLKRLREIMVEKSYDAFYISKAQNFSWITAGGCSIVSRWVEGGVCGILVTHSGQYYICKNIEAQRMVDEELLDKLGFEEKVSFWYEDKNLSIIRDIIGADGVLATDLPISGAIEANGIILQLQRVLSESELGRYFRMGEIFSEVIESYMLTINPGDTEIKIAGGLSAKLMENGLEPVLFLVAADDRLYKYRHAIPTENRVDKFLMISCNPRYKGMVTKISRMMYFGDLPDELREQYLVNLDIENRMAEATKPGVDDIEVYHLAQKLYADYGYPDEWKLHHQGGPQSYTNGFYVINEDRHEVIQLNQIYGYNPSITGTKTEDAFLVTEDYPQFVTYPIHFPKEVSVINGYEYVRPGIYEMK